MNIELRKQKLIDWIGALKDNKTIERLEEMQHLSEEISVSTSEFERRLINEGLAEIESGKTYPHALVMEEALAYLKSKE